jgi:hypothetical protein
VRLIWGGKGNEDVAAEEVSSETDEDTPELREEPLEPVIEHEVGMQSSSTRGNRGRANGPVTVSPKANVVKKRESSPVGVSSRIKPGQAGTSARRQGASEPFEESSASSPKRRMRWRRARTRPEAGVEECDAHVQLALSEFVAPHGNSESASESEDAPSNGAGKDAVGWRRPRAHRQMQGAEADWQVVWPDFDSPTSSSDASGSETPDPSPSSEELPPSVSGIRSPNEEVSPHSNSPDLEDPADGEPQYHEAVRPRDSCSNEPLLMSDDSDAATNKEDEFDDSGPNRV